MDKQIAKDWVKALRSGKFKQTEGKLFDRNNNSYCCLGVLCTLNKAVEFSTKMISAKIPGIENKQKKTILINKKTNSELLTQGNSVLSTTIMKWAGIKTANGKFKIKGLYDYDDLTDKNDSGSDFNDIADIIEKHWKEL